MKNTKTWSIILAVITIVSLILDTVNLEPFGFSTETIGKITGVLTIVKLIYDNRSLFTAQDVADFANEKKEDEVYKSQSMVTAQDVELWKSNK